MPSYATIFLVYTVCITNTLSIGFLIGTVFIFLKLNTNNINLHYFFFILVYLPLVLFHDHISIFEIFIVCEALTLLVFMLIMFGLKNVFFETKLTIVGNLLQLLAQSLVFFVFLILQFYLEHNSSYLVSTHYNTNYSITSTIITLLLFLNIGIGPIVLFKKQLYLTLTKPTLYLYYFLYWGILIPILFLVMLVFFKGLVLFNVTCVYFILLVYLFFLCGFLNQTNTFRHFLLFSSNVALLSYVFFLF